MLDLHYHHCVCGCCMCFLVIACMLCFTVGWPCIYSWLIFPQLLTSCNLRSFHCTWKLQPLHASGGAHCRCEHHLQTCLHLFLPCHALSVVPFFWTPRIPQIQTCVSLSSRAVSYCLCPTVKSFQFLDCYLKLWFKFSLIFRLFRFVS